MKGDGFCDNGRFAQIELFKIGDYDGLSKNAMFAQSAKVPRPTHHVRTNPSWTLLIELFSKSSRGGGRGALLADRRWRNNLTLQ